MQSDMEMDGLFGDMWDELDVPSSPPLMTPSSATSSPHSNSNSNANSNSNSNSHYSQMHSSSHDAPMLAIITTDSNSSTTSSSLSPEYTFVPTLVPLSTAKKRKTPTEFAESANSPNAWMEYSFGPKTYPIHDALSFQPMEDNIDIVVQNVNSNCSYSAQEGAWICYRQNQFKVICLFRGPPVDTLCVNEDGKPKKVIEMCSILYSIKQVAGVLGDEMRVGLHHVGKKRLKSAKMDVEMTPFVKGKIEFCNLQFEKSNSVKKPQVQSEYFHIVVGLYAKCQDKTYHILSKISPRIVVRGQNPGFYDDKLEAGNNNAFNNNTTTTTSINTSLDQMYNNNINVKYDSSESNNSSPSMTHSPAHSSSDINNNSIIYNSTPSPSLTQPLIHHNNTTSSSSSYHPSVEDIEQSFVGLKKRGAVDLLAVKKEREDMNGWVKGPADAIYHNGRVGINTSIPMEALTVHGNMLVTGDIYKPSDRRIKSQIEPVDYQQQLDRVRDLKIYDYQVQNRSERGVIAQELAVVMPEAVHGVGDAEINNNIIPNLLVVNERSLLYENIGATKQLDNNLKDEKANIITISSQMNDITAATSKENTSVEGSLQFIMDVLFKEEHKKKVVYAGLEEEFINFQFSVFRMGPARSLFLLGHFAGWLWILGSLYMFSNVRTRRCLGLFSFIRLVLTAVIEVLVEEHVMDNDVYIFNMYSGMVFASIMLLLNYRRLKIKLHPPKTPPPGPWLKTQWRKFQNWSGCY